MGHIYAVGYEYFTPDLGTVESMPCRVCGAECVVKRGLSGPRSSIEAMGRPKDYWKDKPPTHDSFYCPHAGEEWHDHALYLFREIEKTKSVRLQKLMREELHETLGERRVPDER